ncbi:MAG TPA: hypothetical protein VF824_00945 [Thermoanaerobaculia bacterium]
MQPTSPAPPPPPVRRRSRGRLAILVLLLLVTAFLAGYVPGSFETRRLNAELAATQLDLELANLHRLLGVASHEAQRNNLSVAAAAASQFFEGCRRVAANNAMPNRPRTHGALVAYATQGDMILGQLAVGDPQVKERLAQLYLVMNGVIERRL